LTLSFSFRPRLADALRGYDRGRLVRDVGAGLTVGVVALPLAMAFAIASGLPPAAGLWTAILAGALVALLGGSPVQIAGPAGAFIVIVYGILERHGPAGLLVATAGSGVLLFLAGALRLGRLVRYVPVGIITGFTNAIAVLIAASQLRDLLGLRIDKLPADLFAQLSALTRHLDSFNAAAFALGVACVAGLALWPRLWATGTRLQALDIPGIQGARVVGARIPGPVVALVTLTLVALWLELPVETIGSRFGGIPGGLPGFAPPPFDWAAAKQLVGPMVTLAMLGAIESLLCARVADQLSRLPRHDADQELMAQGIANAVVPFFGGMPATGTIARTVTNVRAGATSPVAGLVHAVALAVIVLAAAPLALHVPLAVLAGILLFTAWNMGDWRAFGQLRQAPAKHRVLVLVTFVLTLVFDLTVALQVGLVAACVLFARQMGALFRAEPVPGDAALMRWRLHGTLFFGAVTRLDALVQAVEAGPDRPEVVLLLDDLQHLDSSGLDALRDLHRAVQQRGGRLRLEGANGDVAALVERSGFGAELAQGQAPGGGH
jgi:SulP family sulfate permease